MLAAALAHLLAVVLVFVLPVVGYYRYQELNDPQTSPDRRHQLFVRSVVVKWCLVPPLLALWASAPDAVSLWGDTHLWWLTAELLVGVLVGAVVVSVRLRSPRQRQRVARVAAKFSALIPRTPRERRFFVAIAVTAGVTEELAYRAFLIAYIAWILHADDWTVAAIIAGVIFGLVHAYQGWKGVLQTGLLGILFGVIYPSVGLVALMVVNTLIDLRLLLLPADLVTTDPDSSAVT